MLPPVQFINSSDPNDPQSGTWYEYIAASKSLNSTKFSWTEANNHAKTKYAYVGGVTYIGQLAVIGSAELNQFLNNLIEAVDNRAWFGTINAANTQTWKWIDPLAEQTDALYGQSFWQGRLPSDPTNPGTSLNGNFNQWSFANNQPNDTGSSTNRYGSMLKGVGGWYSRVDNPNFGAYILN